MKLIKCDKCGNTVDGKEAKEFKLYMGMSQVVVQKDVCNACSGIDPKRYRPDVPKSNQDMIFELLIDELVERGVQMEE